MTEPIASKIISKWRKPGFLLEPLGWVQNRLSPAIEVEPRLIELLFDLNPSRMHLVALALAHLPTDVPPDLALILLQGSQKTILKFTVGHRPVGIDRALQHLHQKCYLPKVIGTSLPCSKIQPLPSFCIILVQSPSQS